MIATLPQGAERSLIATLPQGAERSLIATRHNFVVLGTTFLRECSFPPAPCPYGAGGRGRRMSTSAGHSFTMLGTNSASWLLIFALIF